MTQRISNLLNTVAEVQTNIDTLDVSIAIVSKFTDELSLAGLDAVQQVEEALEAVTALKVAGQSAQNPQNYLAIEIALSNWISFKA